MAAENPGFSARLSQELICNGWSKRAFARRVGVHENSLNKYTIRGGVPKWDVLVSMAKTLGRSVEWLLSGIDHPLQSRAQLLPQSVSSLQAGPIGKERRSTYKIAGLKERDCQILAAWFARDPEARDLLLAWAQARASGRIPEDLAEKVELQAKAMALYVLNKCNIAAQPNRTKEIVGEWGPNNHGTEA
jgi:transcriptional regulator with XRE-family HTH domain